MISDDNPFQQNDSEILPYFVITRKEEFLILKFSMYKKRSFLLNPNNEISFRYILNTST